MIDKPRTTENIRDMWNTIGWIYLLNCVISTLHNSVVMKEWDDFWRLYDVHGWALFGITLSVQFLALILIS